MGSSNDYMDAYDESMRYIKSRLIDQVTGWLAFWCADRLTKYLVD